MLEKLLQFSIKEGDEKCEIYKNLVSDPRKRFSSDMPIQILDSVLSISRKAIELASCIVNVSEITQSVKKLETEFKSIGETQRHSESDLRKFISSAVSSGVQRGYSRILKRKFQQSSLKNLVEEYRQAEQSLIIKVSSKFVVEAVAQTINASDFTNLQRDQQRNNPLVLTNNVDYQACILDHVDYGVKTYRNEFVGKPDHSTFIGVCDNLGPVIVSMVKSSSQAADVGKDININITNRVEVEQEGYHIILRAKDKQDIRKFIPESESVKNSTALLSLSKSNIKTVLSSMSSDLRINQIKRVTDKEVEKKIMELDEIRVRFCDDFMYELSNIFI